MPMQVLSYLLSFPATHPALPAALHQKALLAMLSAFCQSSALSVLTPSAPLEQARRTFRSEPDPDDHANIKQAVVSALETMAALGHEGLLEGTAVPVLYATAQLDGLSGGISASMPGQSSIQGENDESNATVTQQAVSSSSKEREWRRDVALRALAGIACASSSLRQQILARLTDAIPTALAGVVPNLCNLQGLHDRTPQDPSQETLSQLRSCLEWFLSG